MKAMGHRVNIANEVSVNALWLWELLQDYDSLRKQVVDYHTRKTGG